MKKTMLFSSLFCLSALLGIASPPGPVDGTAVWFRTAPVSGNLQGLYRWFDFSGDSSVFYSWNKASGSYEFTQLRSQLKTINFNPALDFSKGDSVKWGELWRSSLSQGTFIGVFAPYELTTEGVIYGIASGDGGGSLVTSDKVVRPGGAEPLDYGDLLGEDLLYTEKDSIPQELFKEHSPKVLTYYRAANPNTSVWGCPDGILTMGSAYNVSDEHFNGPFDVSGFNNTGFKGYSPELLIYNRILTPGERRRVESYLAMKYGITLNDSYLDRDGNLIWDRAGVGVYHNRVTAVSRDDAGDFLQPVSTTSYEEGPAYMVLKENDSYHKSDSYGLPSESHLLVMGREYGNSMPDKSFLFWGDDGGSLETHTSSTDTLWHIMDRTWLVRTNMPTTVDAEAVRWTASGMTVTSDGFLDNLMQQENTAGTALTPELSDGTGFIEFQCPFTHPHFDVGFAFSGEGVCAYGIRISSDGSIMMIADGEVGTDTVATNVNGSRISVTKTGDMIYLRINGVGSESLSKPIPHTSRQSAYRGIISAAMSDTLLSLSSVRSNGFTETGYFAELGHNMTHDMEFYRYSRNRTVMFIDPTGEGRFDAGNTVMVRCSIPDMERGKTIFHNIPWDADGNGYDLFTFAYFEGLMADFTAYPAGCKDGIPQKDGRIGIDIAIGSPTYDYVLRADSVTGYERDSLVRSGSFISDKYEIDSLFSGVYMLEVRQTGGTNLYASVPASQAGTYASTERMYTTGTFSWKVADIHSGYRAGIEHKEDYTKKLEFGFEIIGDKAYPIEKENTKSDRYVQIKEGDVLSFRFDKTGIYYMLNDSVVHKAGKIADHNWGFCVDFKTGETRMYNMTVDGEACSFPYSTHHVIVEELDSHIVRRIVKIGNGCDASVPNEVVEEVQDIWQSPGIGIGEENGTEETGNSFRVYPEDENSRIYTAELTLARPDQATLFVFDAAGRLQKETQFSGNPDKQARFELSVPGVYVVKAITSDEEYTTKIIVK